MSNTQSSVSLDLTDNTELQAYLKGKQPGDDYRLTIKGKIVDLTAENFTGGVVSVVEDQEEDESSENETAEHEASEEEAAPKGMGAVMAKAMGSKSGGGM